MDNITHSLAGALLGQIGLKRKTGLAMPTLIITANLPDIDAVCSVFGLQSLAMRRGLTHGPVALVLLPLILTAIMIGFDRWQAQRRTRPADRLVVNPGWLLALACIGCLSHPALDWMNNYGIRLLEPFSSRWFYGDTLFIIDVWMWAGMGLGLWIALRREKRGLPGTRGPAIGALALVCLYVFSNGVITGRAETLTAQAVTEQRGAAPDVVVANPLPVTFWQREMLWQGQGEQGTGSFALGPGGPLLSLDEKTRPTNMANSAVAAARLADPDIAAFLFWARMPYADIAERDGEAIVTMRDMRFANPWVADRFTVVSEVR